MIIVGIDTETTGIDSNNGAEIEIVEIGYVIYETDNNLVISSNSELFAVKTWGEDAEKIHGIPQWATQIANHTPETVDISARILAYKPELIVAHYAPYDYPKVIKHWPKLKEVQWLCTKEDLPHEQLLHKVASTRLMHLAVDYGFTIPGWHRAMVDAEMCCRIAAKHDLKKAKLIAQQPKFKITTRGRFSEEGVEKVKQLKFRWHTEEKFWWKDNIIKPDAEVIQKILTKVAPSWTITIEEQPTKFS